MQLTQAFSLFFPLNLGDFFWLCLQIFLLSANLCLKVKIFFGLFCEQLCSKSSNNKSVYMFTYACLFTHWKTSSDNRGRSQFFHSESLSDGTTLLR